LYPIFGVEIEVFVKIKPQVKANILNFRSSANAAELPDFLWEWDFNLSNEQPPNKTCDLARRQAQQRKNVKMNLSALISEALGPDSGWKCVGDASLKEWQLDQPPEPRSWCKSPSLSLCQSGANR
jgi:hypothetical protein